jgi:hypothetical protein
MKNYTRKLGKVIQIDENQIQEPLGEPAYHYRLFGFGIGKRVD